MLWNYQLNISELAFIETAYQSSDQICKWMHLHNVYLAISSYTICFKFLYFENDTYNLILRINSIFQVKSRINTVKSKLMYKRLFKWLSTQYLLVNSVYYLQSLFENSVKLSRTHYVHIIINYDYCFVNRLWCRSILATI